MEETNYWTLLNRRRLSRRTLLAAGATTAAGAAAAAVVGCGGSGPGWTRTQNTPHPDSAEGAIPGGSVTYGRLLGVLGIDPHIDLTGIDIDLLLYSYLYSWTPSTEEALFNNFALDVEMPADDHTEFIFGLRPGVKIQPQDDNPAKGEELTPQTSKRASSAAARPSLRRTSAFPSGYRAPLRRTLMPFVQRSRRRTNIHLPSR